MSAIDIKVEIGADFSDDSPLYFRLDDPVKGLLDNTQFRLGGTFFYDITNFVLSVSTNRGRNEALDRTDAGLASITLDNTTRQFDPLFEDSLFYGFLVPRRSVRITANNEPVFLGFIEDVDLQYRPGKDATVRLDLSDGFSKLATARLPEVTPDVELPGARITRVLDLPEVAWPADQRDIATGTVSLLDTDIQEDTVALDYLQLVNDSEFGNLFIAKDGKLVFRQRDEIPTVPEVKFSDNPAFTLATRLPPTLINNIYGSENLYTRIVISNSDIIPDEVIVEDATNAGLYGVRTYAATGLLIEELAELETLADLLLDTYKEPRFRYDSVQVAVDSFTLDQVEGLLELEIGDIVEVEFTPVGIPPAIKLPCRIIGIQHAWATSQKTSTFALETLQTGLFILDSNVFGLLDSSSLAE
jgi:hypothetical protein